ncbi:hemolysin III family protein [Verminephrobacter aporrectodeae subsp. tuberculatae]|uniref:Hemolysin III family protein n=1 Tax=Verminephrobacter aporrectodeae subsp. tuberculatae TaxID=1110392 RepID=A0ABT3KW80_9BURK|nr:hemolysin III family protein [Verminephrobacter aporrectodeae]MCW5223205.1 hemolysin III family protein [Verminephrobacter aporrectodeae subsp. tuberculatae]MCW5288669.1 hemolysin III family protein [Verminephrobacter aporrectodeae subsp. tuberculatae]MCW5322252.1 hemolysin III family protein [Verminephrobacter aporrectodeae subsp. tuberculatae]
MPGSQGVHDAHEEAANSLSHGVALLGACLVVPELLRSARHVQGASYLGVLVFVVTMALLYAASTIYHALPPGRFKQCFLKLDHAAIYLFIAGSYTPFALGSPDDSLFNGIGLALVWLAAAAGFTLKVLSRLASPLLSTALYVVMGWLVLLAALPLMGHVPAVSAAWLVIGGAAYTLGLVFLAFDATVRYAHAVWHGFVAAGTACHTLALLSSLSHPWRS